MRFYKHKLLPLIRGNEERIGFSLLAMLFVSQFLQQSISYYLTALLIVFWLICGGHLKIQKTFQKFPVLWLPTALFFAHVIGLIYTDNFRSGRIAVEQHLSFVIAPLVLFSLKPFSKQQLHQLFGYFTYACFVFSLYCLGKVYYQYFQSLESIDISGLWMISRYEFTWPKSFNVILVSLYVGFSMIWLHDYLITNWKKLTNLSKGFHIFLLFFFLVYQVQMSSRTIFFTVLIIIYLKSLFHLINARQVRLAVVASVCIPILFIGVICSHKTTRERFADAFSFGKSIEETQYGGYQLRFEYWKSAWQVIQNQPVLGVGTGDAWDEIIQAHRSRGFKVGVKERSHAHNQYIQYWMTLGIPGLLILLANLFVPVFIAIQRKQYFYLAFLMLIVLTCLTDTMLGFYKFIFFFAFTNALFLRQVVTEQRSLLEYFVFLKIPKLRNA